MEKNELLTRFDIPLYKRKGYEHTYLGPSVYNSVKYSFRYSDRLYAGVVAEKDAGEPLGAFTQSLWLRLLFLLSVIKRLWAIKSISCW